MRKNDLLFFRALGCLLSEILHIGINVLTFKLEKWVACAPGLSSGEDWNTWLRNENLPQKEDDNIKAALSNIPAMLRRRFTPMGRIIAAAAQSALTENRTMPIVFASRHGDIDLTLSLLQNIAKDEFLSPTSFSLAVHNATVGLLSIARKDTSAVTAIAATEQMLPMALLEAATQLQDSEQVLCLLCNTPLPDLYRPYATSSDFSYTIAMMLSRNEGAKLSLIHGTADNKTETSSEDFASELHQIIDFLTQDTKQTLFTSPSCGSWLLSRV